MWCYIHVKEQIPLFRSVFVYRGGECGVMYMYKYKYHFVTPFL